MKSVTIKDSITSLLMRPTSVGKDTQHELGQPLKKLAYVSNHRGPLLLHFTDTPLISLPPRLHVKGDLSVIRTPLKALPEGIIIDGDLYIGGSAITCFPQTMTVKGNIYLGGNRITQWPENLILGGAVAR